MKTLLILEDEADIRELIALALMRLPLDCLPCSHLADARTQLARARPDFVLTDLQLPDGDGLALLGDCAQRYPGLPVAVITAFADTDSAIEALRLGAVDYLKKPLDTGALRALIGTHVFDRTAPGAPPAATAAEVAAPDGPAAERAALEAALLAHRWNKRAAAAALGLSYRQLRYRVKKLGLD